MFELLARCYGDLFTIAALRISPSHRSAFSEGPPQSPRVTTTALTHAPASGRSAADFRGLLTEWRRRRRYRAELRRLLSTGPHLLEDIGLTAAAAAREAARPFWR